MNQGESGGDLVFDAVLNTQLTILLDSCLVQVRPKPFLFSDPSEGIWLEEFFRGFGSKMRATIRFSICA